MPQVSSARPPLMDMFVHGDKLPDSVGKPHLRAWLAACYGQVYGVAEDDPRMSEMLGGLPQSVRLI
jgi:hypothetical protein